MKYHIYTSKFYDNNHNLKGYSVYIESTWEDFDGAPYSYCINMDHPPSPEKIKELTPQLKIGLAQRLKEHVGPLYELIKELEE